MELRIIFFKSFFFLKFRSYKEFNKTLSKYLSTFGFNIFYKNCITFLQLTKEREAELAKEKELEHAKKQQIKKELKTFRNGVGKYIDPNATKR